MVTVEQAESMSQCGPVAAMKSQSKMWRDCALADSLAVLRRVRVPDDGGGPDPGLFSR
jgi:hypothetical protein